ncbi:MAG: DegV family protein [Chloroflexi bacterium]|nr:DegV family protein [Chloroflexota bacterium]
MNKVRILTDSMSDVPAHVAERLGITVVPAYVQVGDRSYRDESSPSSQGLGREEFYSQLPTMPDLPTTAVPPAHDFSTAYRKLAGETDQVIAILISTKLSGMYNVASLGAQDVPELKVHVVDSEQISIGSGWLVIAAAEAAAEGKSVQEILTLIEEMKPRVHVYAMLDTLEYMRRSGRVSWARAKTAQILRIKPIIEVLLGQVKDVGRTRTRRRAIDQLVDLTCTLGALERLAFLHTYAPDLEAFRHRLTERCTRLSLPEPLLTVSVTTIIGTHVGPRALGVAAVTTK